MDRCDHCPVPADAPCRAQVTGHRKYCVHAAAGHPGYVALLKGDPVPIQPPLPQRAMNFAGAIATAVASGGKRATPEERERRLSICRGCEHFDAGAKACLRCGCHMPWKVRLEAWHCPLDPPRW